MFIYRPSEKKFFDSLTSVPDPLQSGPDRKGVIEYVVYATVGHRLRSLRWGRVHTAARFEARQRHMPRIVPLVPEPLVQGTVVFGVRSIVKIQGVVEAGWSLDPLNP